MARRKTTSRCCDCGAIFTSEAAERRHSDEEGHSRFEIVVDTKGKL